MPIAITLPTHPDMAGRRMRTTWSRGSKKWQERRMKEEYTLREKKRKKEGEGKKKEEREEN